MNIEDFSMIVEAARERRPFWFEGESERVASLEEFLELEEALKVKLPVEYKEFIQRYPGGYFAFINMFSILPGSNWYLIDFINKFKIMPGFIPISDDQSGGFYGYVVVGGVCESDVYYYYPMEADPPAKTHASLYEYIISAGLASAD